MMVTQNIVPSVVILGLQKVIYLGKIPALALGARGRSTYSSLQLVKHVFVIYAILDSCKVMDPIINRPFFN